MMTYHQTIESLIAQGLLRRDGDRLIVTPEGDAYTRALIATYPDIDKTGLTKRRRK